MQTFISPRSSQDSSLIARIAFLEKRVDEMEKQSSFALQVKGSDISAILKSFEKENTLKYYDTKKYSLLPVIIGNCKETRGARS